MRKWLGVLALVMFSPLAWAVSPYVTGNKVAAGDIQAVMGQVEGKLSKAGFKVLGKYAPSGLAGYGVVVVTDPALLGTVKALGGSNIVGSTVRVGVKADGSVSYMNPDYWFRAYFRDGFKTAERTVKGLQAKLAKSLGAKGTFGGDVAKTDLIQYQYMFGMESFDSDKNLLVEHLSFEDAVKAIQDNLAHGTAKSSKVYEVIIPEKKMAVFGVAMNDAKEGDGWWTKVVGPDNIAALPYEIYVVGPKANHLFARYRIALGWPAVGMGQFMRIVEAPYIIQETLSQVAGGAAAGK